MIELSGNIYDYLEGLFGKQFADNFMEYSYSQPVQYLRTRPDVIPDEELKALLNGYGIALQKVERVPDAYKVINGSDKTGKTIEYTIGRYYIQSLSSMIPAHVLNPGKDDLVLDLCAAPGSKTSQLADMMKVKGTLIANEISQDRIRILIHNLDKLGLINMGVLHSRGETLGKAYSNIFDKILVDAPCSALGIVQKRGEVSNWWNIKNADKLADTQLKLLIAAIKMAKPGGEIVYSTCTLTAEENELVLNKVLDKYPVEIIPVELPVVSTPGLTFYKGVKLHPSIEHSRRIIPWEIASEGFFIAKLRKTAETESKLKSALSGEKYYFIDSGNKYINEGLKGAADYFGFAFELFDDYLFAVKGNDVYIANSEWDKYIPGYFQRIGTRLGVRNKQGMIYFNSNAMRLLDKNITAGIYELKDMEELKTYFAGGTIKGLEIPSGSKAVKYNNYLLGSGISNGTELKSQFPRSMRTHEIIFPDDLYEA